MELVVFCQRTEVVELAPICMARVIVLAAAIDCAAEPTRFFFGDSFVLFVSLVHGADRRRGAG